MAMRRFGKLGVIHQHADSYSLDYFPIAGQQETPSIELHPLVVYILSLLDKQWTVEKIVEDLPRHFDIAPEHAQEITDDVDVVFERHFTSQQHEPSGVTIDEEAVRTQVRALSQHTPLTTRTTVFKGNRSPFPMTLQWLVTDFCNRKCVYCYQGAPLSSKTEDSSVDIDVIKRLIRETAQLGGKEVLLTGGEPLLREDIYEVMVYALQHGLTPDFISKQFVSVENAKKLAAAGLKDAFFSIDSLEKEAAKSLTGIGGFAKKIGQTVENMVTEGIRVHAKSLLTSLNAHAYTETLETLERLGAHSITIDTYSDNLQRHDDDLHASVAQMHEVRDAVDTFLATQPKLKVYYRSEQIEKDIDYDIDGFVCHNGRTQLLFYPNGDISKCDKKLPGGDMIVGSVLNQSVFEAWNSTALLESLDPPRDKYKGTPCFTCDSFDTCNIRGRCYYGAYMSTGTLYGPQEGACKYMVGVKSVC
ncbi:radical SAM protein [Pseudoalteromonas peptidolytica]|nr:radical SAM protein [Pseudoalteromonas peptidolytica]